MSTPGNGMSKRPNEPPALAASPLDLLADLVTHAHTSTVFDRAWYAGAWSFAFDLRAHGFHVINAGEATLRVGAREVVLGPGDVALVTTRHTISSRPGAPTVPFSHEAAAPFLTEEGAGDVCMMCGAYTIEAGAEDPVFANLPELIVVRAQEASEGLGRLIALLDLELGVRHPGARTVAARLVDAMLVHILRHWIARSCPGAVGWLNALDDPMLARALALMHHDYAQDWDLHTLARAAHTSRSTLARRFSAEVGTPPMRFLTRRRLGVARALLRDTRLTLDEIAAQVGYSSAFALSKAFKREYGHAPTHDEAARSA